MSKILISGSCGFIFSNVVLYFLQHTTDEIVSIDKLTYAGSLLNVPQVKRHKLYIGDVCDYDLVKKIFEIEKPDIVIHAAAESHVDNSILGSKVFVNTNVVGTHSMLEAALKAHTPQKFINISTDEIYGSVEAGHSKENDQIKPRSPYSSTKASADLLGQSYFTTYGLPVITTRCSNNYGPRQHIEKFIPKAIANIMKGEKIPLYGDGKNKREWIYVKDHFRALQSIIEKGIPGEAYNISSGAEKENIEVLKTILTIMNADESFIEYVKDRPGHDTRYSVDCTKLKNLDWKPQYSFEDAIAHTIMWYRSNGSWFIKK
ncbi:MAG: dTDP-glucose 4,6-dehydratase [Patescibacteria group bacterium]